MSLTVVPVDYYMKADLGLLSTGVTDLPFNASITVSETVPYLNTAKYFYGFCLVLIPTATILGNLLVILSVLRFKALHSAINFLILGLAVADLLVAVSVMPYAVYIYVQDGAWYLGSLMCDIYSAFDVACSTASILLLAVISFDRYRAVSLPIQYSRQSQNTRRVFVIIIIIWIISLSLASPMVLGVNNHPPDASPHECRFYNPEFSIGSSIVSFVIPCFVVLFVYIQIMMALRKREMAARARRQMNQSSEGNKYYDGSDEAGQILDEPVINVMVLPSMIRRIRSYKLQRAAVKKAGKVEFFNGKELGAEGASDKEDDNSDGASVFENSAVAPNDSGIDPQRGSFVPVLKKGNNSIKKQPIRNGSSRSTSLMVSKSVLTLQALCLSSFLLILGTATSAVRRTASVFPRKLNVMALAINEVENGVSLKKQVFNQTNFQKKLTEKRQSRKFHCPCSGAPLLSPLMLQRFVADTFEQFNIGLSSRFKPMYRRVNNTINHNDLAGSLSPHSSTDSFSENADFVTNNLVSENLTSTSRRLPDLDSCFANSTDMSFNLNNLLGKSNHSENIDDKKYNRTFRQTSGFSRRSFTMPCMVQNKMKKESMMGLREPFFPNFLSLQSPQIFRQIDAYPEKNYTMDDNHLMAENNVSYDTVGSVKKILYRSGETNESSRTYKFLPSTTRNAFHKPSFVQNSLSSSSPNLNTIIQRLVTTNDVAEVESKGEAPTTTVDKDFEVTDVEDVPLTTTSVSKCFGTIIANQAAIEISPVYKNKQVQDFVSIAETNLPSVSFNIGGKKKLCRRRRQYHSVRNSTLPTTMKRQWSCTENVPLYNQLSRAKNSFEIASPVSSNIISSGKNDPKKQDKRHHVKPKCSIDSLGSIAALSISNGKDSEMRKKHNHTKFNGSSSALAVRIVKKTINRKESSLKSTVTKAQRKERRATKTLGVVVGIFLICWVPFFSINIINAICVRLENASCEIGFGPFFYTTWIGYMNSFMNPIIYTIFNTEFRRAFKSLILGRKAGRRHNRAHNV